MHLGSLQIFQSFGYDDSMTDGQVYDEEVRLAVLTEELGFDSLWSVEHHFNDYAFCPDNITYLAHVAGLTKRILLGTGAAILPWHQPLRLTEQIAMLDQLSGGRALFGMGRGLARREYELMDVAMDSSRARFDEAAPMILDALETGVFQGDGPYYAHPPTPIRPRPSKSFADRKYCVAMSPDSVETAARLGARMTLFLYKPIEEIAKDVSSYQDKFREYHHAEPPRPVMAQFAYCDRDPVKAEEKGRLHITQYLHSLVQQYEFAAGHYGAIKGYESYGQTLNLLMEMGLEAVCDLYLSLQVYGTPEQMIERTRALQDAIGTYDMIGIFRYAGISYEEAEASMRTYASDVMPTLRKI